MEKEDKKLKEQIHSKSTNQRTEQQNSALHLFYELFADELRKEGKSMRQALQVIKVYDAMPTAYLVKEHIWRPMQVALLGKKSTIQLSKQQDIDMVYETLCKAFAEIGITLPPFPSLENNSKEQNYE